MINSSEYEYEYSADDEVFPVPVVISLAVIFAIVSLLAIIGNTLTILAFFRDRKLQDVYNTYILNLAVTDLLLGCISVPFYAVATLRSYRWPFGYDFCKIYSVFDFTLCVESVLIMVIISHDRLLLLKLGPLYASTETRNKALVKITVSWVVAFLVYSPAIIGWDLWTGVDINEDHECDVQFANNVAVTMITAILEFFIPVIALTSLNFSVFLKIRKHSRFLKTNNFSQHDKQAPNGNAVDSPRTSRMKKEKINIMQTTTNRREKKAAKSLAVLVFVFVITWAPYTVATVILSFCWECVDVDVYEFFIYLLWIKAVINPFLYAFNSVRFRKNIQEIICCFSKRGRTNAVAANGVVATVA